MTVKNYTLLVIVLLLGSAACAQSVNTDSLSLVSKISDNQLKLGKLQNMVSQKTNDKQDAATQAQSSATKNAEAAAKLSKDPLNKDLSRNADDANSDARRDAKRAWKAADDLDDLNKEIAKLQDKINQQKDMLGRYAKAAAADSTSRH